MRDIGYQFKKKKCFLKRRKISSLTGTPSTAAVLNDEQRLLRDLFHNYSKSSRPVLKKDAQVAVTFRAKLKQIIDLVSTRKVRVKTIE